jgi:type I restriction-modification system DNA methylase subunit
VLVTNYRDFLVLRREQDGTIKQLERYILGASELEFWAQVSDSQTFAQTHSKRFEEFLEQAMLHNAPIQDPADLAWFLASYAREAKARVVQASSLKALKNVRKALEDGLGINFDGTKGEQFFQSTLVQTLFYGLFSAWVLWAEAHNETDEFDWKNAGWELHIPVMSELFHQLSSPKQLRDLNLVEVMGWAGDVLNRVVRREFFRKFQQAEAVRYFYEPFLKAFDPDLRKQFGVWYTPHEVVQYMVKRVDRSLRDDLGIPLGLADKNVIVLDPCTGTGSFIVEVLRRIARTLEQNGAMDALQ